MEAYLRRGVPWSPGGRRRGENMQSAHSVVRGATCGGAGGVLAWRGIGFRVGPWPYGDH